MPANMLRKNFIIFWFIIVMKFYKNIYIFVIADKQCPIICQCTWIKDTLKIDCSNRALNDYPDFYTLPVEYLDLSSNQYETFPKQLAKYRALTYLDLSNNRINFIEASALMGFDNLRIMNLSNNGIKGWSDINAKELFQYAYNLNYLNLNDNILKSFNYDDDYNDDEYIQSDTLEELSLDNCYIEYMNGDNLDTILPNLKYLNLNNNPLKRLNQIASYELKILSVANCSLREIHIMETNVPNLNHLNLSWNPLYQLNITDLNVITLKYLDLSNCYINTINLYPFINLISINLEGNSLRHLYDIILPSDNHIKYFDISRNFLTYINLNDFKNFIQLKYLDLSYNEIKQLHTETFQFNMHIETINLSHNVIEIFPKLLSKSLRIIDLSWCPIIKINYNSLIDLKAIQILNISNSLLREFSSNLTSMTLQYLDLSYGRLIHLDEKILQNFPKLYHLRLNGNRLTQPLTMGHFLGNNYLTEIWLDDNPWICNCSDRNFQQFYNNFTTPPRKIFNMRNVKCSSPIHLFGLNWLDACHNTWLTENDNNHSNNNNNKKNLWLVLFLSVGLILSFCIMLKCLKNYLNYRQNRLANEELNHNQRELRNIQRLNSQILTQPSLPNAPNEMFTLPSYEDALKMPKPIRATKSLMNFTIPNKYHQDNINKNNEENFDNKNYYQQQYRKRYHSAQILTENVQHQHLTNNETQCCSKYATSSSFRVQNLQSAENLANFQSYENSPYTKRKMKYRYDDIKSYKQCTIQRDSIEFLTDSDFEMDINTRNTCHSPFSQRKPKHQEHANYLLKSFNDITVHDDYNDNDHLMPAIENYYSSILKNKNASNSPQASADSACDDNGFHILIQPEIHSLKDIYNIENSDLEMEVILKSDDNHLIEVGKHKKRKTQSKYNEQIEKMRKGEDKRWEEEDKA